MGTYESDFISKKINSYKSEGYIPTDAEILFVGAKTVVFLIVIGFVIYKAKSEQGAELIVVYDVESNTDGVFDLSEPDCLSKHLQKDFHLSEREATAITEKCLQKK